MAKVTDDPKVAALLERKVNAATRAERMRCLKIVREMSKDKSAYTGEAKRKFTSFGRDLVNAINSAD